VHAVINKDLFPLRDDWKIACVMLCKYYITA
jgi:hypothetical protein